MQLSDEDLELLLQVTSRPRLPGAENQVHIDPEEGYLLIKFMGVLSGQPPVAVIDERKLRHVLSAHGK